MNIHLYIPHIYSHDIFHLFPLGFLNVYHQQYQIPNKICGDDRKLSSRFSMRPDETQMTLNAQIRGRACTNYIEKQIDLQKKEIQISLLKKVNAYILEKKQENQFSKDLSRWRGLERTELRQYMKFGTLWV